jgi:hypothetical protein
LCDHIANIPFSALAKTALVKTALVKTASVTGVFAKSLQALWSQCLEPPWHVAARVCLLPFWTFALMVRGRLVFPEGNQHDKNDKSDMTAFLQTREVQV